jgi:antitoxin (DNA-binding transcriptional repressor) of toxin-antitoxin stability system
MPRAKRRDLMSTRMLGYVNWHRGRKFVHRRGGGALTEVASGSYLPRTMRSVGLKVLKNKLSEYVRLAAGGETVLVTDRDRVVAEIVPPQASRSPLLADAMLEDAYRKGLITPAVNPSQAIPPSNPVMTFQDLMRDLEESRQDW